MIHTFELDNTRESRFRRDKVEINEVCNEAEGRYAGHLTCDRKEEIK